MSKWEYLVLENYQNNVVDEDGVQMIDESGTPIYDDIWTSDGEEPVEFEGPLVDVLNDLGGQGWQVVATTGSEFIDSVILKREL